MTLRALSHGLISRGMQSNFFSRLLSAFVWDTAGCKSVSLRGRRVILPIASSFINRQFLTGTDGRTLFEAKEAGTLDFIAKQLRDGDVFWDIGANVGCYVAYANACANLSQTVALEPEALNYAELCKTIRLNRLQNVVALCCGAWSEASYADFYLQSFAAGNHSGRTHDYLNGKSIGSSGRFLSGYSQKVHLLPVDHIIRTAKVSAPNVLLMDIDGGEVGAIRGMQQTLKHPDLRALAVEVDDATSSDVAPILLAAGFEQVGEEKPSGRRNVFYCRHMG